MNKNFKPMLSGKAPDDLSTLRFPVLVSPKLDGIRALVRGGQIVSRNLKPIPNAYVQKKLAGLPDGLDGELIVGAPTGDDVMNRTASGVMSEDGEPEFTFWVFDYAPDGGCGDGFQYRQSDVSDILDDLHSRPVVPPVEYVAQILCFDADELNALENDFVVQGYEGVMIRDPRGAYKFGRSTTKEGGLLKLKRWNDAEAVVVGMVERMHNGNEATTDALGRTKRSTHKENKTGRGDLGALVCRLTRSTTPGIIDLTKDAPRMVVTTFELGTGFTDEQRKEIWKRGQCKVTQLVIGRLVTFKYQALTLDGVPRFPVFKGFRHTDDF